MIQHLLLLQTKSIEYKIPLNQTNLKGTPEPNKFKRIILPKTLLGVLAHLAPNAYEHAERGKVDHKVLQRRSPVAQLGHFPLDILRVASKQRQQNSLIDKMEDPHVSSSVIIALLQAPLEGKPLTQISGFQVFDTPTDLQTCCNEHGDWA